MEKDLTRTMVATGCLVLYTDGVTEVHDEGLNAFVAGAPQFDDLTLMLVGRNL